MSLLFFSNQKAFFHAFLRASSFFSKSLSILSALQTQLFARIKRIGVAPKRGKATVFFYSNRMAFFMYFYVLFHFFKVPFDFVCLPKAAFCKDKGHWGTPKGRKMQVLLSLIERHFLMHFYVPFHFFKVDFDFAPVPKAAFCNA